MRTRLWFGCALAVAAGCSKPAPPPGGAAPSASVAGQAAGASAAPEASASATRSGSQAFAGPYVSKVGAVEPPAAAKEKAWADDPGTAAVGQGTIELSVDGAMSDGKGSLRKVSGEVKGALGHLIIAGTFDGQELRANVAPQEPNQPGAMTGYMALAAETPTKLKGMLRVANGNARIVREASVELARK